MKNKGYLEEFKNGFFELLRQTLNYDEFLRILKGNYWLLGKEWLADAIPWRELKEYQIKPVNIHMLSDAMGLLVTSFELIPSGIITFSLLKKDDRWYIDWQNREVWLLATDKWNRKNEGNLEVRFFRTFGEDKIDSIFQELHRINEWIQRELGSNQEKLVIVFGFDSFEYFISGTGNKPSGSGGNSRGKLILMCENFPSLRSTSFECSYYKSILLHEMVHEYTCYDKQWNGSIENMSLKSSMASEGIALYYQFKFLMENIDYTQLDNEDPIIIKIRSGIMEALTYRDQVLEFFSNQIFTDMNRKNPESWNPSYFLGASLYSYFLQKFGFENTRSMYSQVGNMDFEVAKLYLEDFFNKEEYLTSSRDYFDNMLDKLHL
ncbi:MAG: hypothetical protein GX300_01625 [Tissierellia bacterium]|nr:hypothetical protein [Tissierellia bacterium]